MRLRASGMAVRIAVAVPLGLWGVAAVVPSARAAGSIVEVSGNCGGQNAEVEEATAAPDSIYLVWIGCGGIGYSRSTDGGATFSAAVETLAT